MSASLWPAATVVVTAAAAGPSRLPLLGVLCPREFVLASGDVRAVLQPIVDLDSGAVVADEALARGPVGELERPDLLFAEARRIGRLAELDELDELCRRAALRAAVDQFVSHTASGGHDLSRCLRRGSQAVSQHRNEPSRVLGSQPDRADTGFGPPGRQHDAPLLGMPRHA